MTTQSATGRGVAMVSAVAASALTVVQSRINGQLGDDLNDGILAAWVSFAIGLVAITAVVFARRRTRRAVGVLRQALANEADRGRLIRPWQLLGGMGGATFVAAQGATVQYLGVAVFTVAVVAAQNANSLVVDRIGLGPAGVQAVTSRRVIAAIVATLGVVLAVSGHSADGEFQVWALCFALVAGLLIAIQQALNGQVSATSGSPYVAGLVNFIVGFCALTLALCIERLVSPIEVGAFPPLTSNPIIYVGGFIGVIFIVVAASVVHSLGVLLFALLSIAGQMGGALVMSLVAAEPGQHVDPLLVIGIAVTGGAVALAATAKKSSTEDALPIPND